MKNAVLLIVFVFSMLFASCRTTTPKDTIENEDSKDKIENLEETDTYVPWWLNLI